MKRLVLVAAPLFVTGCFLNDFATVARPQLDSGPEPSHVQTIGDVSTDFENATELVVTGPGVVTGLDGTGGPSPPSDARTAVIERLKRAKIENPAEFVDSPDCAIVIVTAVLKPGVRRDELVDVEVSLPQGSKARSLRGGVLQPTPLATYATQEQVRGYLKNQDYGVISEGNRALRGHEVAVARGSVQAALTGTEDAAAASDQPLKRGFVWKGAKVLETRAMFLVLKTDQQRFRVAEQVANRLNEVFHGGESAGSKIASARHKDLVAVAIPPRYRLNRHHYMRVVRAIPLDPPADLPGYLKDLDGRLQNPETALSAAIRLEALGNPGVPVLKDALTSEYPLVRFAAAEALAYLGNTAGADVLQKAAAEHPALQAFALTALAALDDALGMSKLEELLAAPEPELRYGAFRALREIDATNDLVRGQWASRAYAVHEVATPGPSLVHLLTEGRSEIVLFGAEPKLIPPFSLTAGPSMTVTARPGDTVATVSRFSARSGQPTHAQCALTVADVLRKMAELGATYSDAADAVRKADERKALSCPLAVDALPRAVPVKRLAQAAREDPRMEQERELLIEADAANAPAPFAGPESPARRD
jgi:flagellar basal body P-ring protein FlgI